MLARWIAKPLDEGERISPFRNSGTLRRAGGVFGIKRAEEAFHRRRVPDLACAALAARDALLRPQLLEVLAGSHLQPDKALCKVMCKELHMATNLALDPDLINRAVKVSGEKTKKAAVTRALEEFISRRSQARLVELMGKLEWDESFDYKLERTRR
jgi:Arc/MetJ family transcription regulator